MKNSDQIVAIIDNNDENEHVSLSDKQQHLLRNNYN